MHAALRTRFPASSQWTDPEGGLFLWCRLPPGVKAGELFEDAIREKVAFVPGRAFFAAPPDGEYFRLNFSNRPPDAIADGMGRLGQALQHRLLALAGARPGYGKVASGPNA